MGLSLDDIRIISRSRNGRLPVECGALSDCLRERLRTVEREIERLRARRRRLVKSIELCRRSKSGSCLLLRRLTASPALKRIDAAARP